MSLPPLVAPMLAGASGIPSRPERYQFEPKLDGQRLVVRVWDGNVDARSRNNRDATAPFPELAPLPSALPDLSVVLDGEMVALDRLGRPDFGLLQTRMHVRRPSAELVATVPVTFMVFDLLWIQGQSLCALPQSERRRRLEDLGDRPGAYQIASVLSGDPADLLEGARAVGIEGLVAKRLDSPYRPGARSDAWAKIKWRHTREFVVGGWAAGDGSRGGQIGSLAVGYVDPEGGADALLDGPALRYVGQVGSGLDQAMLAELHAAFTAYARTESPFVNPPRFPKLNYVAPLLVVQVAYGEMTRAGTLRHPSLLGLRTDVAPQDVGWDEELRLPLDG